jgi:hypothetical protein
MRDPFHKSKTPEEFAAWLDGNLPFQEMLSFSESVNEDPELRQIAKLCDMTDDDVSAFETSGIPLPEELRDDSFEIPDPQHHYQPTRLLGDACCCCAPPPDEDNLIDKLKRQFGIHDDNED